MPKMAAAQEELEQRLKEESTEEIDIENVDGCEKVIQMVGHN